MSEKIYACLLRLYPPAFRRRYEQETLQLLRDRLRDESSFIRRLRLGLDLIADMIGALPQAYRNSYIEVGTLTSVDQRIDNLPSFQSIRNEPIRRETFLVAGALTLTVLVAFGYVMELPNPSPVRDTGNRSPIESVLDRLNKQAPEDSADNIRSKTLPAVTGSPNSRAKSAGNLVPSPPPRPMPNLTAQVLQPGGQIRDASRVAHASPRSPSTSPSPTAATRQIAQTLVGRLPADEPNVIPSRTGAFVAVPANLSGRWTDLSVVSGLDDPRWFIFNQNGAELSGSAGLGSTHQYPITNGLVGDGTVKFKLSHGQKLFLYDLQVDGDQLRGTLVIRDANETRNLSVRLAQVR